jgi:aldose 1-epimerase
VSDEVLIRHGGMSAAVTNLGATLRSFATATADGGVEILDGFADDEACSGSRGQILMPWPNRIAGGRYRFGGETLCLPTTESSGGNAIHGLVAAAPWDPELAAGSSCRFTHRLRPQPGYPFALDLSATYTLDAAGLSVSLAAANVGTGPAPFGAGAHPYLAAGGAALIDDCRVQVPAHTLWETDTRLIPTSRHVVSGWRDLRSWSQIGPRQFDTAFTDLSRDPDGRARVRFGRADGVEVELWMDGGFGHVMVFTGDTLEAARRRRGLAIEPMSCAADAFNNGVGLRTLRPGERFEASWGISVVTGSVVPVA